MTDPFPSDGDDMHTEYMGVIDELWDSASLTRRIFTKRFITIHVSAPSRLLTVPQSMFASNARRR